MFDIERGIVSLLSNPDLMKPENLVTGMDIFTGEEKVQSDMCSEIHTGEAWPCALNHHCPPGSGLMPLGLVLFGDKSR